ncbi:MAG: c-type cytochrome, partial [Rhodothermales bacterium]|nr:c-type cytochrome [Rhodothermales bacterium]
MSRMLAIVITGLLAAPATIAQDIDLGTDAQREEGRQLYMDKCAQCHGVEGDGNGPAKTVFRPQPRDFTSSTYKFRTTPSGELPTDSDIMRSIREGMPYTGMPAWPSLSDGEVRNLMYFIKTFADDFSGPFAEVTPMEMPDDVSMSEESIERGRVVYEENQCFDCHGMAGRGDGKSATTLEDQWGVHIRPADLTKRWTFRRGITREDIYKTFQTGLDGSPMPSYEIDPPEDAWHLVNFVHSLSRDEPN